jgi:hypothetical protein
MRQLGPRVGRWSGGKAGAALEGGSDTLLGSTTIGDGGLSTTCSCGRGAGTGGG